MRQQTYEKAKELDEKDIAFLYDIYQFRCLDTEQAYNYYYAEDFDDFEEFKFALLQSFLDMNLVDIVEYKEGEAIFLTNDAIEIIRDYYGMATNVVDASRNVIKRGYYTAGELKMLPRLVNHQVHLNRFVLDFEKLAHNENLNYKHYGEKYVSQYFGIRPDGMLRFYEVDIFLEQDMNTESKTQLMKKWDHYRTYLRSKEHEQNSRKIIMFFIVDNTKSVKKRKELVRYTAIDSLIDLFSEKFDVYVGTRDELLDLLFTSIIPTMQNMNGMQNHFMKIMNTRHNFSVRDAGRLKQFLSDTEYSFLAYKTDNEGNILIEDGRLQEFLIDDAHGSPFSIMHKVAYQKRNSSSFSRQMGRHISTIFLVESESSIKEQLSVSNLLGADDVYYTTIKRLETRTLPEALFQFDRMGSRYHFQDSGLIKRDYET